MSKNGSIKYQIERTVMQNTVDQMSEKHLEANNIPRKKAEAQRKNIDYKFIYSYSTAKNVMNTVNRMCKHNNIKNLTELKPEHADKYINHKVKQLKNGKISSSDYVKNEKGNIAKFDQCLLQTGKRSKHDSSITAKVEVPFVESKPRGRYTEEEGNKIQNHIKDNEPKEKLLISKIQRAAGLRITEAVYLKARNVDVKNCRIIIKDIDNITKGGRPRTVQLPLKTKELLNKIKKDKKGKERLFKYKSIESMQDAVRKACRELGIKSRGTHGFRGEFAYKRTQQYLEEQGIKATAYRMTNLIEKHGNGLTKKERTALNKTSNDLGHGKGRIRDIRESYLKR